MKNRATKTLMLLLAVILALGSLTPALAEGSDAPKYLRVSLYSYPTDLEPTNGYYGWGLVRMGIGETLVKFDPQLNMVPWLAESWEQVDDETWLFHIREGVKFHNGNAMTAQNVMETIQRSMDMNSRAANIANIKEMSVDGMDLTIVTNGPYAALLPYLAEPLFTIVDTSIDTSDFANKPIATGPYKVEKFDQSVNTRVVKFDEYWGGEPQLDVIDYPYLQDADARAMALQAQDIDVGQALVNKDLGPFQNNDDYIVSSRPSTKTIFTFMNSAGEFLSNYDLRNALAYAIDRELYAVNFIGGSPATGPYSDTMGWGNENLKVPYFDPEYSMQLMDEAGIVDTDGDGWREMPNGGKKISLSLLVAGTSDITIFKPMSEAMQAQLRNVGIEVVINNVESYTEADAAKDNYLDLMYKHINAGVNNDPQNFLDLYFYTGKQNNFGNYSNPEFDAMMDELFVTMDRDDRIALTQKLSQFLIDDAAGLFLGYPDYNIVTTSRVANLTHYAVDWYCIDKDVTVTTVRDIP
ncbi:MAG: ABC transporter substrate-binding protein [Clostridia bacterium]|nr:ABC transporter substrate-binding protein [Clostridia bacterium]